MAAECVFLIFLALMAGEDMKDKTIPAAGVIAFAAVGLVLYAAVRPFSLPLLFGGMAAGAVLFAVSALTKSIGAGDALLFLTGGIYLGFYGCIWLLLISFFMAAVFSLILLASGRCKRGHEIPFSPFVLAGYMVMLITG